MSFYVIQPLSGVLVCGGERRRRGPVFSNLWSFMSVSVFFFSFLFCK